MLENYLKQYPHDLYLCVVIVCIYVCVGLKTWPQMIWHTSHWEGLCPYPLNLDGLMLLVDQKNMVEGIQHRFWD